MPGGYQDSLSSNTELGRAVRSACDELETLGGMVRSSFLTGFPSRAGPRLALAADRGLYGSLSLQTVSVICSAVLLCDLLSSNNQCPRKLYVAAPDVTNLDYELCRNRKRWIEQRSYWLNWGTRASPNQTKAPQPRTSNIRSFAVPTTSIRCHCQ